MHHLATWPKVVATSPPLGEVSEAAGDNVGEDGTEPAVGRGWWHKDEDNKNQQKWRKQC